MRVLFLVLPCLLGHVSAIYNPVTEYAGPTFFDKFAYYGNVDNTTWGAKPLSLPVTSCT